MQSRKRWQWVVIFVAVLLTFYNILPTIFYYAKPLKETVDEKRADRVASSIAKRVNDLQPEAVDWLHSFCKLLKVSPLSITTNQENPKQILVEFYRKEDAKKFQKQLSRSGSMIPFVPAQLSLSTQAMDPESKKVIVERQIPILLPEKNLSSLFAFSQKTTPDGKVSDLYREIVLDRASEIALALGGTSESALQIRFLYENPQDPRTSDLVYALAQNILQFSSVFKEPSAISNRFFANLLQDHQLDPKTAFDSLILTFDRERDFIKKERVLLAAEEKKAKEENSFVPSNLQEKSHLLDRKERLLLTSESLIKKNEASITCNQKPWSDSSILSLLKKACEEHPEKKIFVFDLDKKNPFFEQVVIDFSNEKIFLNLHKDIVDYQKNHTSFSKEAFDQLIINEMAHLTRKTDEKIASFGSEFVIHLNTLSNSKSFLVLKLQEIARSQIEQLQQILLRDWAPKHPELAQEVFPIFDYQTYQNLSLEKRALGLVLVAPAIEKGQSPLQMRMNSLYVVAKGVDRILHKYEKVPNSAEAQQFFQDFKNLEDLLKQNGFFGYPGSTLSSATTFNNDFIFERSDAYRPLLASTREQFHVYGSKKYAILEFSNVEQRILTQNQIETSMHEDLLKWKDEYLASQVSLNSQTKNEVPKPTKSILWDNIKLSVKKYFRGDDRKILHWGLDLSGGKTVQIELRDRNNSLVSNEADLKQGVNELYNRVNKMGVSEVNIRRVDPYIVLDFPGSQSLSASELVKASSMFFHVVNEKFSPTNKALSDISNRFLQEVWNEAVVTNRKDSESINAIAWKHLYGDIAEGDLPQPQSEAAKILYENGLRLASFLKDPSHNSFNDSLSKIALMRGENFSEWQGQTHPLLIVFQNYALEGADLTNIHASYDPSKGNYLSFEVKSSRSLQDESTTNPRENLYQWTSRFSKEKIAGTPLELLSRGRGWRMAVLLNDSVISAPALESALRENASISGNFSQREVNNLVSDLKAGSLSFTPRILSEKNVSPELGKQERLQGILATCISFLVVIVAMMSYYRFAGTVASIAVFFNLLIIWGALQNLGATLSLAGLAGIILTVAMAVDANVLVNERIREDFTISGKLAPSIQSGYRRAFSAIFDSNITTIIAALILLHFDAGPIKGFAVTLIIGIVSSMFSALFATRTFFSKWVENPKNSVLKMHHLIHATGIDFLRKGKYVFLFAIAFIAIGLTVLFQERSSILGMDFTGGVSLNIELQEKENSDYRGLVEEALQKAGASKQDFQIRELSPANHLRLLIATTMEKPGKPFAHLPLNMEKNEVRYPYQNNPRIAWVVETLQKANLSLTERSLSQIHTSWSSVSGQMSESMRNNALIGLGLAFFAIVIYLTFRFEFKYAFSALICLFHDVAISLGSIALLHAMGVGIQIDLNTVAAIMTIVGYSLNDTIIIFDRIREERKILRKLSLAEVVNHSLNVTLSRTLITSGTTLLALIPLVIFGGATLFSFAFVMVIGVIFGTLSSIYIASPCMLLLQKYENRKQLRELKQEESA
jgi:SecD/SecF fusion protein